MTVHDIQYDSPGPGRVSGLLFVPRGDGPFAGVLVQHGLPGSAAGVAGDAALISSHGAIVLAIDAPFARRGGSPIQFTAQDSAEQVQLMLDLQRGLDILMARPDVDRRRVAYRGWSYGGAMGALFAAIDKRLSAAILAVPDGGLVAHFTGPEDVDGPLRTLPCVQQIAWLQAMQPIEPIRFVHLTAPTPLLIQSGRRDNLVPPRDAEAIIGRAPEPKTVIWYDAGHGLTPTAMHDQIEWLSRHIGTSPPLFFETAPRSGSTPRHIGAARAMVD